MTSIDLRSALAGDAGGRSIALRRDYKVPAAEKALDILEFMAARDRSVTQTEISAGLGRSIHEVYRVIQVLEGRGYLARTRDDRYRLTLKLFELAHTHPPVARLIESALPVMRVLAGNTDQSCHLVVLRGVTALVVLQIDSPLPMRYSVAIGSHFPVLETSSGTVLLALLPTGERDGLIDQILAGGDLGAARGAITPRLNSVVELGYEMRASLAVEGCTNVSVPVRDHLGAAIAALTVPYLPQTRARFDRASVLVAALAAAREVSRALGAPDTGVGRVGVETKG